MNRRRAILGLCMLCALLISAFASQSANAASNGTTLFTCKETGAGGSFTKAHCKPGDAGSGNFSHVAVAQDTTTEIQITNAKTANNTTEASKAEFKTTIGGIEIKTTIPEINGVGTIENKIDPTTGEHYLEGTASITLSGVTDSGVAECEVYTDIEPGKLGEKGVIHLEFKVSSKGQGDSLKFTPVGTEFGHYSLENCKSGSWSTYKIVGSFTCKPDGATINCNHSEITSSKTLRLTNAFGPIAGLQASMTLSGRAKGEEAYKPLSPTTVAT